VSTTSYKPSAEDVKRLREESGAGMMECRNALVAAVGDFDKAKEHLAERGQLALDKKADRTTNEGLVGSYVHAGGKIGVLVEVACETDFVARNERFVELVRDIAIHVAAMGPTYLNREAVPADVLAQVKASFPEGEPDNVVEGRFRKWYEDNVLLDQSFVKDDSKTVGELIAQFVGILGEKLSIRRFVKFALGDE
jgi:elongation factor Ts